jgi:hypothetical protein
MNDNTGLAKVVVETDGQVETIWAEPVGRNQFRVRNQPLFAMGLSFDDVVSATTRDGLLHLDGVVEHGGHSTYRVMLADKVAWPTFEQTWAPLRAIGCTFERFTERYLGVDVPPQADIYDAYRLLEAGMAAGVWLFEEAHVGHALK